MIGAGAWAMLAAASLLIGAVVALKVRVPPQVVGDVMGFGAGALVAALAYELIPTERVADWLIWVSFGTGALVFYGLDSVLERRSAAGSGAGPVDRARPALY
jgi:ZIP family zinc transporter